MLVLYRLALQLELTAALQEPASASIVLHDLAVANFHAGRALVAKHILHHSIVYLAPSVMYPAQVAVLEALETTTQTILMDLGHIKFAVAEEEGLSTAPWPSPPPVSAAPVAADRIAIVTLCDYDPADSPLTPLSASNKHRYATAHGYRLYFETMRLDRNRPPAWSKLRVVQKYMTDDVDWVMWMDCDSFFMNDTLRLQDLLPHDDGIDFVLSEDGLTINTGVFLLRNSPWSARLLDAWYGPPQSPFVNHPHWEQAALQAMLTRDRAAADPHVPPVQCCALGFDWQGVCGASFSAVPTLPEGELLRRTLFHPQRWLNTYPVDLSHKLRDALDRPTHTSYTDGDYIVSFSGCNNILGRPRCAELFGEFYDAAEARNKPLLSSRM